MSSNTVVLITGASQGIGHGLVAHYLSQPSHTVLATTRSATPPSSLTSLSSHPTSKLITIPNVDPTSQTSVQNALSSPQVPAHIDIVIANAGYQAPAAIAPLRSVAPQVLQEHLAVNTFGVLHTFQAVWPRMQIPENDPAGKVKPKFVFLGSPLGSAGGIEKRPVPLGAYGASKTAGHYIVRKIHTEEEGVTAFVIDPGFVASETGNKAAQSFGMEKAPVSIDQSVAFITGTVDKATREETGGRFVSIEGEDWPW